MSSSTLSSSRKMQLETDPSLEVPTRCKALATARLKGHRAVKNDLQPLFINCFLATVLPICKQHSSCYMKLALRIPTATITGRGPHVIDTCVQDHRSTLLIMSAWRNTFFAAVRKYFPLSHKEGLVTQDRTYPVREIPYNIGEADGQEPCSPCVDTYQRRALTPRSF